MNSRPVRLAVQMSLLWLIYAGSNELAALSGLPLPGNVLGVIVLFLLLLTGVIRLQHIQEGADFLLRHLVFFFIPPAVGLMIWGSFFMEHALSLGAAIVVSAALPFWTVGYIAQLIQRRRY